jgi:hypothetical protein
MDKVVRLRVRRESRTHHPFEGKRNRIPARYDEHILYYPQVDTLIQALRRQELESADIRPDAIVLFPLPFIHYTQLTH